MSAPAGSEEVVRDALPPLRGAVPRTAEPFLKMMLSPLGGVPAFELTLAVKVTACPTSEGLSDEVRVFVVDVIITSLKTEAVLPTLLVSPLYFAEME